MKSLCIFFIAVLGFGNVIAQFELPQIVSENMTAFNAIPHDVDNDGYIDIVSNLGGQLVWFKNQDGLGDFGSEIIISETTGIRIIDFVDIDMDGDKDLLYSIPFQYQIGWLENLDGIGSFGTDHIILIDQTEQLSSVTQSDIDNDGDIDILIKQETEYYSKLSWRENVNGLGVFGEGILIIEGDLSDMLAPILTDIDNDGNKDILTSYEIFGGPAKIVWYKGLGDGNFDIEQEIYQFDFFLSDWTSIYYMKYADVNTDGLKDIVITSNNDDIGQFVQWLEAIDGQGDFHAPQRLLNNHAGGYNFYDIDADGDNDLLGFWPWNVDEVFWWENVDGLGTLDIKRSITNEFNNPRGVRAADFTGNGLLDVVATFSENTTLAWFENTGILGISEKPENKFALFPNPTSSKLTINSKEEIVLIELFDSLGKKLITFQNTNSLQLNNLATGVYFAKITGAEGASETHKIIKL